MWVCYLGETFIILFYALARSLLNFCWINVCVVPKHQKFAKVIDNYNFLCFHLFAPKIKTILFFCLQKWIQPAGRAGIPWQQPRQFPWQPAWKLPWQPEGKLPGKSWWIQPELSGKLQGRVLLGKIVIDIVNEVSILSEWSNGPIAWL